MTATFVAILVVAVGAAYWFMARREARPKDRAAAPAKAGGRFSGVEIRTRGYTCLAARALVGQRFLAKDAPGLPLTGCTAAQCTCTFSKLADRRTEGRRLDFGGLSASQFIERNRRSKRDRRRAAAAPQRP